MKSLGLLFALLASIAAALAAISLTHSGFVQARLVAVGAELPIGVRASAALTDLIGLAPALGGVIGLGFGIAFGIAALIKRRLPSLAAIAYPVAGAVAIATALLAMKTQMDITPIAGARDTAGLVLMILGGALGGWIFEVLRPKTR